MKRGCARPFSSVEDMLSDTLGKGRHQVDRWKDGRSDDVVVFDEVLGG
jgi:hypothetical protein